MSNKPHVKGPSFALIKVNKGIGKRAIGITSTLKRGDTFPYKNNTYLVDFVVDLRRTPQDIPTYKEPFQYSASMLNKFGERSDEKGVFFRMVDGPMVKL